MEVNRSLRAGGATLLHRIMQTLYVERKALRKGGLSMAMTLERRYPVGIQTFSEIREHSYVYIDKTAFVYRLAHESEKAFFLSHPRRSGKSLLVSTMQSYFEGRKELFEGLEVAALESDWVSYPVFHIDLSTIKTKSADELRAGLSEALQRLERRFGADGAHARRPPAFAH